MTETTIFISFYRQNCMVRRMCNCVSCELKWCHEYPPSQKWPVIPLLLWLGLSKFFIQKLAGKIHFCPSCTLHINGTQYEISSNVADVHRNNCVCPVRMKRFVGAWNLKTMATLCTHSNWFNFWFHCCELLWSCDFVSWASVCDLNTEYIKDVFLSLSL